MPTEPTEPLCSDRRSTTLTLGVCAVLLAPVLTYRLGLDQGVFAYIGAELLEGRWPYLATWDHAFPGAMFLHALEILLLGKSVVMFRAFDFVYQLVVAGLIFRIGRELAGREGAFVGAATYVLIYQGYGPWNTAQREGFAMLFVLLGFWLYLTNERRDPMRTAAGIGVGIGMAALFKPTLLALAALYVPLLWDSRWRRAKVMLTGAAGIVAPGAVVVGFYALQGGLVDLYEATIAYQLDVYVDRLRGEDPLWIHWLSKLGRLGLQTIGLALAYVPFLFVGQKRRERLMIYLGYLAAVYTVFVQGTFAGYHYLPGLALGSILVAGMVQDVFHRVLAETVRRWAAAAIVAVAVPVYQDIGRIRNLVTLRFLEPPQAGEFRIPDVFDYTESYELAAYLKARTEPSDTVQVWGHESLVYYLADRDASSRFQTSNPLVMRRPGSGITAMQERWRREFLGDVVRRPPRYVAVVRGDHWWWAPEERSSEQLLDDFPEWKAVIESEYVHEHTVGRFLVYRHEP